MKHVGAFVIYFNVNLIVLKQIKCALVGLIIRLDKVKMHGTAVKITVYVIFRQVWLNIIAILLV
jgi:hypothetical protein